jgi:prophage regulatory protein
MPTLNETTIPENRPLNILRNPDVCRKLGISPTTLWRWGRDKNFPSPIQLGPNTVGWIEAEIDNWLAGKAQSRGGV